MKKRKMKKNESQNRIFNTKRETQKENKMMMMMMVDKVKHHHNRQQRQYKSSNKTHTQSNTCAHGESLQETEKKKPSYFQSFLFIQRESTIK